MFLLSCEVYYVYIYIYVYIYSAALSIKYRIFFMRGLECITVGGFRGGGARKKLTRENGVSRPNVGPIQGSP